MSGPQTWARFDIAGKLAPEKGWKVFYLTPRLTPAGVPLIREDRRADDRPGQLTTREVVLGYRPDE